MILMTLQYVLPLLVLLYTYTRIALMVWGKRTPGEANNTRDRRRALEKRKVTTHFLYCLTDKMGYYRFSLRKPMCAIPNAQ